MLVTAQKWTLTSIQMKIHKIGVKNEKRAEFTHKMACSKTCGF